MGVLTGVPALRHVVPGPRYAVRVRVCRAGEWVDITSRVASGVIYESNDEPVATLELNLYDSTEMDSLVPRRKDSPLNYVGSIYSPLLDHYNEILVEAAVSTDGDEPTEWVPQFGGYLGDDIDVDDRGGDLITIRLSVRNYAKRLQDTYITDPITLRNMYASEMIQALLDEFLGDVQLRVIGEDDYWVEEVTFEFVDLWQAIQSFCEQSNKDIRYMLDESDGQIKLTYWTPSTAMVPGWIIDASEIRHETLNISDVSVRHRVVVRYLDADGYRQEVVVQNLTNRKPHEPIRTALIQEADTSTIRDEEAALRLASAVLEALRTPPATDRLILPFNPRLRVYDVIQVANPAVRSEPEVYAVEAIRKSFSATDWSMEVIASDSVKVRHVRWLEKEAKQQVQEPPRSRLLPPANLQVIPVIDAGSLNLEASWRESTASSYYEVRWRPFGAQEYQKARTEDTKYTITGLPPVSGAVYPGPDVYPGSDLYPEASQYEVGVLSISPFGRSSPVVSVVVNL